MKQQGRGGGFGTKLNAGKENMKNSRDDAGVRGEQKIKEAHLSKPSSESGRAVGGKTGAGQVCVPVTYPGASQQHTQGWKEETHKAQH